MLGGKTPALLKLAWYQSDWGQYAWFYGQTFHSGVIGWRNVRMQYYVPDMLSISILVYTLGW